MYLFFYVLLLHIDRNMFAWLWAKPKTPAQMMNETLIELKRAVRGLERAREDVEDRYAENRDEAKALASAGRKEEARELAKQMIRYRGATIYMTQAIGKLEEVQIKVRLQSATQQMQDSMLMATRALLRLNGNMSVKDMRHMLRVYEKQSMALDDKQQQMDEAMDDAMSPFDNEEEEGDLYSQILEEIGMELDMPQDKLSKKPTNQLDDDLSTRLQSLRNNK